MQTIALPKVDGVNTQPAAEMDSVFYELTNLIQNTSQTLSGGDLNQMGRACAIYGMSGDYFIDSGAVNAYILAPSINTRQVPPAYVDGMRVRFLPQNSNTTTSTVNVASLGVKPIFQADGVTNLGPGNLVAGFDAEMVYRASANGATGGFVLLTASTNDDMPIGASIYFDGLNIPNKWLSRDGSAKSRTTYAALFNVLTFSQNGATTNSANTVTGLSDTSKMFIGMALTGSGIPGGTTVASIVNGTSITMSANASASATVAIIFYPWGAGDGSTTFNLPDGRGRGSIGAGSGGGLTARVAGQSGGAESVTLTASQIPDLGIKLNISAADGLNRPGEPDDRLAYDSSGVDPVSMYNTTAATIPLNSDVITSDAGGLSHNNMQPFNVSYSIIKYA